MILKIKDNVDEWKSAWSKCENLRELCVSHCTLEEAEIIFSTPKEHLKVVDLSLIAQSSRTPDRIVTDEDYVKKVMEEFAQGTQCLEKLAYHGPHYNSDTSSMLFQMHRASLSSIAIRRWRTETNKKKFVSSSPINCFREEEEVTDVAATEEKEASGEDEGKTEEKGSAESK